MSVICHDSPSGRRSPHTPLLATVLVAGMLIVSSADAAKFGHSRLISGTGEPLRVAIPVTQINATDAQSLRVIPAPVSEWTNTGLTPPVELSTLQTRLVDGQAAGTRVIQVWSDQVFDKPIADLLLDIHTSSGVQRYQVSLLAQGGAGAVQAPAGSAGTAATVRGRSAPSASASFLAQKPILIRRGDTMFSVAQRHAVAGVSVYQMMIALLRANPHAFIHDNLNLVKAGEQMSMPDMAALTAISDREARRLFHEQVVAYDLYRRSPGAKASDDVVAIQPVTHDVRQAVPTEPASNVPESRVGAGDQLKLSSGSTPTASVPKNIAVENSVPTQGAATGHPEQASSIQQERATPGATSAIAPVAHAATTAAETSAAAAATATAASAPAPAVSAVPGPSAGQKDGAVTSLDSAGATGTTGASLMPSVPASASGTTNAAGQTPPTAASASQRSAAAAPHVDQSPTGGSADATVQPDSATQAIGSAPPSMGSPAGSSAPVTGAVTDAATDDGTQADDELATRKAIDDAQQRVSQLEENVKNLNRALQSQGEAAKDLIVDGAIGLRQSLTDVATAVTDATIGDKELIDTPAGSKKPGDASSKTPPSPSEPSEASKASPISKVSTMDSMIAWVQDHLLAVITATLAFIVLAIAWGLRRANVAQASSDSAVTPEMVKEKLEQINLDLNEPTIDDTPSSRF